MMAFRTAHKKNNWRPLSLHKDASCSLSGPCYLSIQKVSKRTTS